MASMTRSRGRGARALGAVAVAIAMALASPGARAGQSCEEHPITRAALEGALAAGQQVAEQLDGQGASVALVGRQGQDLSKYGLKYSHVGIAYKAQGKPWRVVELLNRCGSDSSDLWSDGLANFFLDDPFTLDSVLLLPSKKDAEALMAMMSDPARLRALHARRYNMVAYPFSTRYQNSNQWVLEVVAAARAGARPDGSALVQTREQAQAWLKATGYKPTSLNIGAMTRLGGRMFKANVAFDDHPNAQRFADRIDTATVASIIDYARVGLEGWRGMEISGPQ